METTTTIPTIEDTRIKMTSLFSLRLKKQKVHGISICDYARMCSVIKPFGPIKIKSVNIEAMEPINNRFYVRLKPTVSSKRTLLYQGSTCYYGMQTFLKNLAYKNDVKTKSVETPIILSLYSDEDVKVKIEVTYDCCDKYAGIVNRSTEDALE